MSHLNYNSETSDTNSLMTNVGKISHIVPNCCEVVKPIFDYLITFSVTISLISDNIDLITWGRETGKSCSLKPAAGLAL